MNHRSMSSSRRARFRILASLLGLAVSAGCTSTTESPGNQAGPVDTINSANQNVLETEETPIPGGRLVYGLIAETNGWNPSSSQWAASGQQVSKALFDTLSTYDEESKIHPFLAERFDHNDAYDEWRITLREGVTLHNGKPVTADVVRRNQQKLMDSPLTASIYRTVENFETDGDRVLVVNLVDPWVTYPYSLASQIGVVVDPDWMESGDGLKPIGTGPFSLESWTPDKAMTVKKNPNYWREGLPLLDEIEFQPIPDDTTRTSALEANNIDIMQASSGRQIRGFQTKALGGSDDYQVFGSVAGESTEVFVMINTLQAPLNDLEARQALAYATDSVSLNDSVNEGYFQVARGPFPPESPWYVETDYPTFDPVKAQELVDKVKAKNGGRFAFRLSGSPTPSTTEIIQLLKQQWEVFGIEVELEQLQQLSLIVQILSGQYQATIWQQFDAPNPVSDSIWWHPESAYPLESKETSLNFARNENPVIGAALDRARATPDPTEEREQYGVVQTQLAADLPYIWLYHSQISVIADKDLVNVTNAQLPDGGKIIPILHGAHQLSQIWRRPA